MPFYQGTRDFGERSPAVSSLVHCTSSNGFKGIVSSKCEGACRTREPLLANNVALVAGWQLFK